MIDLTNKNTKINFSNRPTIRFNGGSPVCLCNNCYVILHRIYFKEELQEYKLINGESLPLLCQTCLNKENATN